MMESLGLRCGKPFLVEEQVSRTTCFVHHQNPPKQKRMQMSRACKNGLKPMGSSLLTSYLDPIIIKEKTRSWEEPNEVSPENLDEWMRDSVSEIVRHIGEAPFLMHVYSKNSNKRRIMLEREKSRGGDTWLSIKRRWKEGCPIPDGVILVEQLDQVEDDQQHRAWGVVIQGRGGVDCAAPACYILKTCRVMSSFGFCTHFCLLRAKCFGETAELQLQNSWNAIDTAIG